MTSDDTDDLLRRMDDLLTPGVVSRDWEFPDAMRWAPPPDEDEPTGPPTQDSYYDINPYSGSDPTVPLPAAWTDLAVGGWVAPQDVQYPDAPRPAPAAGSRGNPSLRSAVDAAPSARGGISRVGWDALARATAERLWTTSGLYDAMQAIADAATAYTRTLHEIHDIITNNPSQPPVHTRHLNATAQQRITQARSNRGTGPTNPHRHDGRTTRHHRPHRAPQPWAKPATPPPTNPTTPDNPDARPLRGATVAAANSGAVFSFDQATVDASARRMGLLLARALDAPLAPARLVLYTGDPDGSTFSLAVEDVVDPAG